MATQDFIRTDNLAKDYGRKRVVNGVSLELNRGEIISLLGPNGAGKTTTFKMMVGFVAPTEGRVFFNNENISKKPIHERARMGIAYLAQEPSIFRKLTVEENLRAILEGIGLERAEQDERVEKALADLRISHLRKQVSSSLSGGEKRRVEVARCLATNPKFIFLDEPFAQIDPKTVEDIQGIIMELKARNLGVLITDHSLRETLSITDRAYMILEGRVVASGTMEEVTQNEEIRERYFSKSVMRDLDSEIATRQNS
ncbi:MAG: LPS export ABC transporter ATP-binding protein [Candidatus Sumerlaeia bacterium]|nr:LPS export ABC transporter ATP-binding protein [Candidatus Sumerlaeia bacterium]